uniref:Uncharacterized protein n=1 Tax=Periophthalmus magnuspinnatus TaxID=409849 RepID=A0A3B3ZN25_9GOBI
SQPGVCRYGRRLECCYGWKKNSKGHQCEHGCKHGECVGPNKCKCFPGYTGKTCNQLNECGLKPRPCEHRCMNTHGSYKCYCLNGYTLMPDGSCASRTCSLAYCQYGCEEVHGEIRCLCPSTGLQLGQDERTCVDECVTGKNLCPYNRQCVNTFGSYFCKCQEGYDLKYTDGKYECVLDECLSGVHKCSHHAACLNTQGSYKCRCKSGFRGNGFECSKNIIPEPAVTEPPKVRQQPFDYDGEVYIGSPDEERPKEITEEEEEENNQLNPRGDVFAEYYMAMSGFLGEQEDIAKLKLLLSDRAQQGSFCLTFDFRVVGNNVGTLRVLLDNNVYPIWEQSQSQNQAWQTEFLTVAWREKAPETIIFEAQQGGGVGGEIGLDNVVLTSGPCQDDTSPDF